jgi:Cu(I)/Ag(I) efflux system membrane protein CusA/SilA
MLHRLIDVSVRNPIAVFLLVAAAAVAGWWSMHRVPLDAIPDLGDAQVIVVSRWDRSPDIVEDQVTYPIVTALVGAPGVKAVRGLSDFGASYVYVIFDDGTDIYWARSRTLEYLSAVTPRLPAGVTTEIGPDATGLGWVYQYVLADASGTRSAAELRSIQDWYLRYHLRSVPGVADVAPVGGFVRQYQVNVDPNRLRQYGIPLAQVIEAIRGSNADAGGRMIEVGGTEYMVRGRGYATSTADFASVVVARADDGTPVRVGDVADVVLGPELRRGVADLDGRGDVVSGIVIMRQGHNALDVIDRVKTRLAEIAPGLPPGVTVVGIYDRSDLIHRAIATLRSTLVEIMITVALVVLLMLWHVPSAIIPIVTIPLAVLISFVPFRLLGIGGNIMSLGGIAIAVGTLVDAAIVVVEQTHKRLEEWQRDGAHGSHQAVIIGAVKEVAPASFFALLVIAVSFLPVLTLEAEEGRLFKPLAYTKTLAIVVAALLTVTLDPALRLLLTRVRRFSFRPRWLAALASTVLVGRIHDESTHPVSRLLMRAYEPVVWWSLRWKWVVLGGALALVLLTVPVFLRLGSEFMPPLDEGALFYMPSTMPGISVGEAQRLLEQSDRVIKAFPEVDRVLGKAGRAETATDPAPLSMLETVIILKPTSEWRRVPTWYSGWAPGWLVALLRHVTPDHISRDALVAELDRALRLPGVSNAWTMPIKARLDMLATGIRTPVGLKLTGPDIDALEGVAASVETALRSMPGTRSAFAERVGGGSFLDIEWNRDRLAQYGLGIDQAQVAVQGAIGGEITTTTVEGRERYPVNVRYKRDFRDTVSAIEQLLVPVGGRGHVPLSDLATVRTTTGPAMIRTENGLLTAYVYVDIEEGWDPGRYVAGAQPALAAAVQIPAGTAILWSGQYEAMARVRERLTVVIPVTLALVVLLLYASTRSVARTAIVCLAVPFSAVGAVWFLYLLDYNMSVAVWVGLIALVGLDAETGRFMLLYLDLAYERARREGRLTSVQTLRQAIVDGAARRLRPKFMTVATTMLGLVPIMWATGTGADVMKRIAAPMIGGLCTSFVLELLVYPALYEVWRRGRQLAPPAERWVPDRMELGS